MYVDDLADACIFLMKNIESNQLYDDIKISHLNIGCGEDISISELASIISETIDFKGEIRYDISKPDGTMRKLLDVTKMTNLGWSSSIDIKKGIDTTYNWFIKNK